MVNYGNASEYSSLQSSRQSADFAPPAGFPRSEALEKSWKRRKYAEFWDNSYISSVPLKIAPSSPSASSVTFPHSKALPREAVAPAIGPLESLNNGKNRGKRSVVATSLRHLGKNGRDARLSHSLVKLADLLFENVFLCGQQHVDLIDQLITNRNRLSGWPIVTVTDDANETT